jgi:hypothetical protein
MLVGIMLAIQEREARGLAARKFDEEKGRRDVCSSEDHYIKVIAKKPESLGWTGGGIIGLSVWRRFTS